MNKTTHTGLLIAALLLALPVQAGGQREEAMSANVRSSLQRAWPTPQSPALRSAASRMRRPG